MKPRRQQEAAEVASGFSLKCHSAFSASSCSTLFCFARSEPMKAGHQPEAAEVAEMFFLGTASLSSLRGPVQPSFDLSGVDRL